MARVHSRHPSSTGALYVTEHGSPSGREKREFRDRRGSDGSPHRGPVQQLLRVHPKLRGRKPHLAPHGPLSCVALDRRGHGARRSHRDLRRRRLRERIRARGTHIPAPMRGDVVDQGPLDLVSTGQAHSEVSASVLGKLRALRIIQPAGRRRRAANTPVSPSKSYASRVSWW